MTDLAFSDFVQIRRIRKGKPAIEEVLVELDGRKLTIRSEWVERRHDFREVREYVVLEVESAAGRLFRLGRDAEAVERDPEKVTHYWTLIAGEHSHCDCPGFQATEREGRVCRHIAALNRVIEEEGV